MKILKKRKKDIAETEAKGLPFDASAMAEKQGESAPDEADYSEIKAETTPEKTDEGNVALKEESKVPTAQERAEVYAKNERDRANFVINGLIQEVEKEAPVRFAASRAEKTAAKVIRDYYKKTLNVPARMEPFTVSPLSGRQGIPISGIFYALALALYLVGIITGNAAAKYTTLCLSLVICVALCVMFYVQVYLNKNVFNIVFPKKVSYNIAATIPQKSGECDSTVIIAGHYDSDMDRSDMFSFLRDKNFKPTMLKVIRAAVLLSVVWLALSAVLGAAAGLKITRGFKVVMIVLPAVWSGLSIFYIVTYFSYTQSGSKHGRSSLAGAATALAVADYFNRHRLELPDNTKIIVAAFGSKECGAKGSEQMLKLHWGKTDTLINPSLINFSYVNNKPVQIILGEKQTKLVFDRGLANAVYNTLAQKGENPQYVTNQTMYTDSAPFAAQKFPTVSIKMRAESGDDECDYGSMFESALAATKSAIEHLENEKEKRARRFTA